MTEKIDFVAGMDVPVGSTVYTRYHGPFEVVAPENLRVGAPRAGYTIYGERDEGRWMLWTASGKASASDSTGGSWDIVAIRLPATPPLFQVGDAVFTIEYGAGTVVRALANCNPYPVLVRFGCREFTFTANGKENRLYARSLFFAPIEINATHLNRPRPMFKAGNVVINERSGAVSVVSHDDPSSDQVTLFQAGGTSGSTFTVSHSQLRLIADSYSKE